MAEQQKVTVILTSYNHAKFLRESIDSVLNQTYTDFDLIIWDDGSTDDSWQIIISYSDPRIRTFRNDGLTRGAPIRSAMMLFETGPYIAVHHSDDVWEPHKLAMQVAFLDDNPHIGAVFSNAFIIGEDGKPFDDASHFYHSIFEQPNRDRYGWLNYFFTQGNALCHPSVLIRKRCYTDCGLYRFGLPQTGDFDMWVRLCLKYEIHVLSEKLIRFRVRDNDENASASRLDNHIRSQFEYFQVLDNYRQLSTYEEISRVFPAAEKYYRAEGFDSQFVLGMVTLETGSYPFAKLFGLQLLFEVLNDPARAKKLKELYDFDTLVFMKLTGSHDVFSFAALEQVSQELNRSLQILNGQIAEREVAVRILNERVAEREDAIRILNGHLAERDKTIEFLNQWMAERDAKIVGLTRLDLEKNEALKAMHEEVSEKGISLVKLQTQLNEIYKSKSWRVATRLRHLFAFINYLINLPVRAVEWLSISFVRSTEKRRPIDDVSLVRLSGFFNETWYLANNPDVAAAKVDPLLHYLNLGGFEARDPGPHFDSKWYIDTYGDVKNSGVNPLVHYLRAGRAEGRSVQTSAIELIRSSGLFDVDWYLANYPDIAAAELDPLMHYIQTGGSEGRDPGPNFDGAWYLETYKDVKKVNPLLHYLRVGRAVGRLAQNPDLDLVRNSGLFDEKWYLFTYPDIAEAGVDPLKHYLNTGGFEGRDPGPNFHTSWYLDVIFEDVRSQGINPLVHFLKNDSDEMQRFRELGFKPLLSSAFRRPRVSIIIPVYNAVKMTRECVESIYRETGTNIPFEIIVVDNASQDETQEYLLAEKKKRRHLEVLKMEQNIGFGPAVNEAMQRSKSEFIVILNNDTQVSPGWLEHLLAPLERDASIGISSPMTNYVGEGPQIDWDAVDMPPEPELICEYARRIEDRTEIFYEPNRLVFFCVAIRRELVDIIGYLDAGYEKGNFEDDDYCLRARMAGYRLAVARNAFVYHHGSFTFKSNKISHSRYMEMNRVRFFKKAGRIATASSWFTPASLAGRPDISVILRTKDRPLLLQKALSSLANQTFRNFEVVLVNDGGVDVSNLVALFEPQFPIRYVYHATSMGRTPAVNAGVRQSQGAWISYLDDDDILYPWHLEALFQATEDGINKFVYSDYNQALFLEANATTPAELKGMAPWEYDRQELLIQNYIPIHTWLHARECSEKTGHWNESLDRLEDYEFLLRVSENYPFHHVKKVTCEYRYYINSANSIYTDRHRTLKALEQIYQRFPVDDPDLLGERQVILDAIEKQVRKIEEIRNQIGISTSEDRAVRDIIKLVTNI